MCLGRWRFGLAADAFEIRLISEHGGVVASPQGPEPAFSTSPYLDLLLVPGGIGTRRDSCAARLAEDPLRAGRAVTVCTGSALLAKAGVLDGVRATAC